MSSSKPRLVVLIGPTAVGKTELSIQLAESLNAEIVSADSRLFYRGMDIGTAKPTPEERIRVRHHLIDISEPENTISLPLFQKAAQAAILDISGRGKLPILVGGTGQYIRAVVEGWQGPTAPPNPVLRRALENWAMEITPLGLYQRLKAVDPSAAEVIDPQNLRRTIRALEVIFTTGRLFSAQRQRGEALYSSLTIGLTRPRPEIYQRIDERIDAMLTAGLVEEVRALFNKGVTPELPSMSAIGYREIGQYLLGRLTLQEAVMLIKRQTRIFVRRQANWFKMNDPQIHWFTAESGIVLKVQELVKKWLDSEELSRID
jgi:tRNA dimethylallyltransferase